MDSSRAGSWSRRRFVAAAAAALPLTACGTGSPPAGAPSASPPPAGSQRGRTPSPRPSPRASGASGPRPLYLGTYTSGEGGGRGVGLASYDPETGRVGPVGLLAEVADPSYLAVHPDGRTLYAVSEREDGALTAVRLADRKVLGSRGTGGAGPCQVSVHPDGRWLLSANYASGSVAVHPIEASGAIGERTDVVTHSRPAPGPGQRGPHAHQFVTGPDPSTVLAVDLGTDTVYSYRLDPRMGTLEETGRARTRAGAGPRHLTFHPGGAYAYLANEADNTVAVCAWDGANGRLTVGDPQPTGTGAGTNYPAQFAVTADGAFAYLANRGHNSVTRYAVEEAGARLRLLDTVPVGGDFPRHLALSPDGRLLFTANQRSSTVSVFRVDAASGGLRLAGRPFASPVAVCALPL
ncbi:beta-propeller fold lactonase family protein [Streptomyces sp. NPDC058739]|uniref:lactonase family protein n=1 Tax=Streptomyces sp. NPDC058739 TaxID=3346618 RepID=UPI0036BD0EA1